MACSSRITETAGGSGFVHTSLVHSSRLKSEEKAALEFRGEGRNIFLKKN